MKPYLLFSLVFIGAAASAQQIEPLHNDSDKLRKVYKYLNRDSTGEQWRAFEKLTKQNFLLARATYSHTTSKGKVYTMPYDNMPCLVPDMKQVSEMPIHEMPQGRIPNIVPKQPLLPRDSNGKK